MAKDFFRDIGTSIFKPVGDFISGGVTALQPGRVQQMQHEQKRIQSLLDSDAARALWYKARAAAESKTDGVDPRIEAIMEYAAAGDKTGDDKSEAFFYRKAHELIDQLKEGKSKGDLVGPPAPSGKVRDNRDFFAPGGETDVFEALGKKKKHEAPKGELDVFEDLGRKRTFPGGKGGTFRGRGATGEWPDIQDYFQAPTETVPEVNIPKTYPQMGIESIDDQATLEEMQKALPDVDMRSEYESDPELMKKLMELWRQKKLTKQNLHKAFSKIQQTAQQALGIR